MPATIFAGSKVKALKSTLSLNGGADVISSTTDPTSVAVSADPGSLLLNTTSGKLYRKNDSGSSTNWSEVGSGGSGINYVTNPLAATNTTGWSTYADAAGAQPVDGTGGSPTVTWTRSTTTPLRGAGDFNFTKDAANRQGEGVATDITIDLADQAKVLTVSFDYEVLSGTYATGDLTVYLIADPSGTPVVIQPAGYQIQSGTAGTKLKQIATFQTQATGQSYRVCFHVASTSASAYSLAIDNVVVGPQTVQYGAPVTDWVDYTPTGTWNTNVTYNGKWRRVGDSMEIRARVLCSGAPNAVGLSINLPSGYSIDTNKLASTLAGGTPLGYGQAVDVGSASYPVSLLYFGSTTQLGVYDGVASGTYLVNTNVSNTAPFTFGSTDFVEVISVVPILGWSSTVQMSNDTDTRVVAAEISTITSQNIPVTTSVPVQFDTVRGDTHSGFIQGSGYNAVTGVWGTLNDTRPRYQVPVSGWYEVSGQISYQVLAATNMVYAALFVDNVTTNRVVGISPNAAYASRVNYSFGPVFLNAGQLVDVRAYSTAAVSINTAEGSRFGLKRLSGPSAIAATESVTGKYENTAGTALTGNVEATLPFATKKYDSHGAFNGTVFTAPISGVYQFSSTVSLQAVANTTNQVLAAGFRVTSTPEGISALREYVMVEWGNGVSHGQVVTFTKSYKLNAGDTVEVRALNTNSVSLATDAGVTFFCWNRVGN